jgi:putative membrane protein
VPWSWRWQAYPGVWLFVLGVGAAYAWALLRPGGERASARDVAVFGLGLLVLWMGADWPVGVLAAGYLLSVKTLQYLLLGYIAPGLMLLGTPRWVLRRLVRGPVAFPLARLLTRPLIPLAVANGVLVATHLPVVVDNLSRSQVWTFALDLAVIGSGLIFWWPALARLPELKPMSYGARIGYLGLNVFLPTVPASFFTFSQYPIYALYELAPRVSGISAVEDQRVAGILMKLCGGAILFGAMSVMFFRWYRRETGPDADAVRVPG